MSDGQIGFAVLEVEQRLPPRSSRVTPGWGAWKAPRCGERRRLNPEGVARRTPSRRRRALAGRRARRAQSLRPGDHLLARRRQDEPVRASGDQRNTEGLFEGGQAAADGGVLDAQGPRRPRKRPRSRRRRK